MVGISWVTKSKMSFKEKFKPQGVRFDIGNPHTINTNHDHFDIFILGQLGPDFRFAKVHP